jgi:predicted nucleic acid-binding protein
VAGLAGAGLRRERTIAATAIERNLTVVTCDTDYERVPDLKTLVIPRSEFRR